MLESSKSAHTGESNAAFLCCLLLNTVEVLQVIYNLHLEDTRRSYLPVLTLYNVISDRGPWYVHVKRVILVTVTAVKPVK